MPEADPPTDRCFGCGAGNPRGLRLACRTVAPGEVEGTWRADEEFAGAPGVVHGGIQAALLDEAMGMAAHAGSGEDELDVATVDLRLRYRRPVPTGTELRIRGVLERVEGRDYYARGEIVGPDGETLTRAESRWRRLR